jgi:DNA-binding transcriptional ArsR family regulator
MNLEEAKMKAKVIRALGNPVRLMVLDELRRVDRCVSDLNRRFHISQPTLSRHLARLKNAGIVSEHRRGPRVMHHLETPGVLQVIECAAAVLKSDAARKARAAERA